MLSQAIGQTQNDTVEQNSEVLRSVADYFGELAVFVNSSNVTINATVSLNNIIINIERILRVHVTFCANRL